MPDFTVQKLTLPQVRAIYARRLVRDFPPDEVKPLGAIEAALARGEYACCGAVSGDGAVLAYAFFVCLSDGAGDYALLDYYAVAEDARGRGVGSAFLQALMSGPLRGLSCALVEIDDPDSAADAGDRRIRLRRQQFYARNGLTDTGVRANVFGVDFRILSMPLPGLRAPIGEAEVRSRYAALYRAMLSPEMFRQRFRLR